MENQNLEPQENLEIPKIPDVEYFDMAEWLFQFDEDEPVVIAWSNSEEEGGQLTFTLKPNSGSNVYFQSADGAKKMKIFSRRMSPERRQELKEIQEKEREIKERLNYENGTDLVG